MGQNISLQIFQTINDVHISLGSGILGIFILLKNGMKTHVAKSLLVTSLTIASIRFYKSLENGTVTNKKVVLITGCDSGLGFSLALHACEMGYTVFAGCLNINSQGANELSRIYKNIKLLEFNITNKENTESALKQVEKYLEINKDYVLWALINNAGIMVFAEFEWQTENLLKKQLDINLFGTMRVTKYFIPLLRKYSGRIITVTSHCANETLPGLSAYGATKAGLSAWSDGLRVELKKYGIDVVMLIPGSFIQQSNILSQLNDNALEMKNAMTQEQLEFYGDYFNEYNSYLSVLSTFNSPKKIEDRQLYKIFERTLLDKNTKRCYIHEPWRYTFYHTLFKISPTRIRDNLIVKFIQMPIWRRKDDHPIPIVIA